MLLTLLSFLLPIFAGFSLLVGVVLFILSWSCASYLSPKFWMDWKSILAVILIGQAFFIFSITRFSIGMTPSQKPSFVQLHDSKLEEMIAKKLSTHDLRFVGLSIGIVTPHGESVIGFGDKIRPESAFEIGSITKTFTGLLLAQMVHKNQLQLDQKISELLPKKASLPKEASAITLKQLSTHSSGFPRLPEVVDDDNKGALNMIFFGDDPYQIANEENLLLSLRNLKLESDPGSKSEYSNFGVATLGYLLALQSSKNLEELLQENIFRPLEMKTTSLNSSKLSQGFRNILQLGFFQLRLSSDLWNHEPQNWSGAGGIVSTLPEMLLYLKAQMNKNSSELTSAIQMSHEPLFKESNTSSVAMNWMISKSPQLNQPFLWHNGGTGGFSSFIGFTEDKQYGLVILSNSSNDLDDFALDLLKELMKEPSHETR